MMTQSEFHDMVKRSTCKMFLKEGEHLPLGIIEVQKPRPELVLVPMPWSSPEEKKMMTDALMQAVRDLGALRFSFAAEVWVATDKVPENGVVDMNDITPPSQRDDRRECLMVVTYEDGCKPLSGRYNILRDRDGKPSLGDYEPFPGDAMSLGAFRRVGFEKHTAH